MYVHGWSLPREIDAGRWIQIHRCAIDVLLATSRVLEHRRTDSDLPVLRGPSGVGSLLIEPERLGFNGNSFRGESGDSFQLARVATTGLMNRSDLSNRVFHRCNTRAFPYDLAVCAVLLVAAHVLGEDLRLGTEGTLRSIGWREGADLARKALGRPDHLVQDERGFIRWVAVPVERTDYAKRRSS